MFRTGERSRTILYLIATALWLASLAYGQSLGDAARENREKKSETAPASPSKVITNADLPTDPDAATDASDPSKTASAGESRSTRKTVAPKHSVDPQAAERWRREILAQKRTVALLERKLAKLQASIPYVDVSANSRGEVFNRRQAWEQEREEQLKEQLDEQRAKLQEMQEEARRAGMHTAVYDP